MLFLEPHLTFHTCLLFESSFLLLLLVISMFLGLIPHFIVFRALVPASPAYLFGLFFIHTHIESMKTEKPTI